jgi:hypothetical protein
MGDRDGAVLASGDWVCYQSDHDGMVLSTVLGELDEGTYLIELEPRSTVLAGSYDAEVPDHLSTAFEQLAAVTDVDVEVLEVRGDRLVSVG